MFTHLCQFYATGQTGTLDTPLNGAKNNVPGLASIRVEPRSGNRCRNLGIVRDEHVAVRTKAAGVLKNDELAPSG